jgi:hypothetical protein
VANDDDDDDDGEGTQRSLGFRLWALGFVHWAWFMKYNSDPDFLEIAHKGSFVISAHAEKRRQLRNISVESLERAVREFRVIESYPAAYPMPAFLLLGSESGRVIHVAAGFDRTKRATYIITVYYPDEEHFEPDQITRRKK